MRRTVRSNDGFGSIQWIVGFALGLVLLVFAANLVAMQYAKGALTAAASAGARSGALVGGTLEGCRDAAEAVLRGRKGLLRGPYGADATLWCEGDGVTVRAVASVSLGWWLAVLPAVEFSVVSEAAVETLDSPRSSGSSPPG